MNAYDINNITQSFKAQDVFAYALHTSLAVWHIHPLPQAVWLESFANLVKMSLEMCQYHGSCCYWIALQTVLIKQTGILEEYNECLGRYQRPSVNPEEYVQNHCIIYKIITKLQSSKIARGSRSKSPKTPPNNPVELQRILRRISSSFPPGVGRR